MKQDPEKLIMLIGAGRMGGALLRGWIKKLGVGYHFVVVDPKANSTFSDIPQGAATSPRISQYESISDLPRNMSIAAIVLATKPHIIPKVLAAISSGNCRDSVVISVAAGVTVETIQSYLNQPLSVVRVMPNIGAQLSHSVSAAYTSPANAKANRDLTEVLFTAVGAFVWLDAEHEMHIATAISGSGPAYFFAMCEAMMRSAESEGLKPDVAKSLVLGTISASSRLLEYQSDPARLRETVTSPNGTTAAGLSVMNHNGRFDSMISETIAAAIVRSLALSSNKREPSK